MADKNFYCGLTDSIKDSVITDAVRDFLNLGMKVEILKKSDTKYFDYKYISGINGTTESVKVPIIALQDLDYYFPNKTTNVIIVDGVQLFKPYDIKRLSTIAKFQEIIINCYGLMVSRNHKMFPASQTLVESGTLLHLHEDNCEYLRNALIKMKSGKKYKHPFEEESICHMCFNRLHNNKSK
ncbi:MAG TPA: hypothetical protein PLZ05_01615 [Alphaproteobacteria bacterium]|nr:hypothetical protein [Alphaproteobacteria bacterium]